MRLTGERASTPDRVSIACVATALVFVLGTDCGGLRAGDRSSQVAETSAPSNNLQAPNVGERAEFLEGLVARLVGRRLTLAAFADELERRGVHVVQPGEPYSKELRGDYTRFFPRLEGDRVVGGYFG